MRRKDQYIGRLYSDIGKVPSDSGIFRSTGELQEFVLGLNGPFGKGEKGLKGWPHPFPWAGPNWTREGVAPPSFLLPLLLLPSLPSWKRKGTPTRIGNPSWTPPIGAHLLGRPPLPPSFIYVGRGTPKTHKLILSRVRCPPPQISTSVISL